MKIEEAIGQKEFENEYQRAYINLLYTSNWMRDQTKAMFKPYGVTQQQYNILRILKGQHPEACSAGYIKRVMIDKSPDITRLIDRMIKKGWVTREVCEGNRRQVDVRITPEGLELITSMSSTTGEFMAKFASITSEEANELSRILDKIRT